MGDLITQDVRLPRVLQMSPPGYEDPVPVLLWVGVTRTKLVARSRVRNGEALSAISDAAAILPG